MKVEEKEEENDAKEIMDKNILITTILAHMYEFDFKELYDISSKGIKGI